VKFTKTPASNLYGTEFQVATAAAETSTTSTTVWSNKLTITTPALPLGDYRIDYSFGWRSLTKDREADFRIQRAAADIFRWQPSFLRTEGVPRESGFAVVTGISGVQTFTLDFKVFGTGTTIYTKTAYLSIYRVA